MYDELLANSRRVRGDHRVTPGGCGVKEAEIAVSHPHLLALISTSAMSETRLFFSEIGTLDIVSRAVFRGLLQQLIKLETGAFGMAV